jgi:hypothetical protein
LATQAKCDRSLLPATEEGSLLFVFCRNRRMVGSDAPTLTIMCCRIYIFLPFLSVEKIFFKAGKFRSDTSMSGVMTK